MILPHRLRRLLCRLRGCRIDYPDPSCDRCGAHYYDGPFVERGLIDRTLTPWHRLRRLAMPRCRQCRRPLLLRRRYNGDWCCRQCFDEWIPF